MAAAAGLVALMHAGSARATEEFTTRMAAHLDERRHVISALLEVIKQPATAYEAIWAKDRAIRALGHLKAVEAVELLLGSIDFDNPFVASEEYIPEHHFPSIAVLQEIGKPASLAALEALGRLSLDHSDADARRQAEVRLSLLVRVISVVEGPDVAQFLLQRRLEQAEAAQRPVYEQALKHVSSVAVNGLPAMIDPEASATDGWSARLAQHREARAQLIAELLEEVQKPVTTPEGIDPIRMEATDRAIRALGQLKATEAIEWLVAHIDLENPLAPSREYIQEDVFPCVAALRQIGKPASLAALEAIGAIRLDQPERRLSLLVRVISGVEGSEVTDFMIRVRMERAGAAERVAYQRALTYVSSG